MKMWTLTTPCHGDMKKLEAVAGRKITWSTLGPHMPRQLVWLFNNHVEAIEVESRLKAAGYYGTLAACGGLNGQSHDRDHSPAALDLSDRPAAKRPGRPPMKR